MNRQYLSQVDSALAGSLNAKEGEFLRLETPYLLSAIDTLDALSTMLVQTCWRKWDKDPESADAELINLTFEALLGGRYQYAIEVAKFAESVQFASERSRRIVIVNHAIAVRETRGYDHVDGVLSSVDWTATSLAFTLALNALRNEKDSFLKTLPKALAAGEITVVKLREWPLFKPWQAEEWFEVTLKQFGKAGVKGSESAKDEGVVSSAADA